MIKCELNNKRFKCEKYALNTHSSQDEQENQSLPQQESAVSGHLSNHLVIHTPLSSNDDSSQHSTSSTSSSSSSSTTSPSLSNPAMHHHHTLSSITRKLNSATAYDTSSIMAGSYLSTHGHQNLANMHHFQNQGPASGTYMHQQQQYYPTYPTNSTNSTNSHLNTQMPVNNSRNSTGAASSANSSPTSLNSPPSTSSDDISPLHTSIHMNHLSSQQQLPAYPPNLPPHFRMGQQIIQANTGATYSEASNTSMTSEDDDGAGLKKRRPVPVTNKDSAYWEKRRRNNESAKRSRDMRRSKEEHVSYSVVYLQQENLQLRTQVALLRDEAEKLRAMLYNANGMV